MRICVPFQDMSSIQIVLFGVINTHLKVYRPVGYIIVTKDDEIKNLKNYLNNLITT